MGHPDQTERVMNAERWGDGVKTHSWLIRGNAYTRVEEVGILDDVIVPIIRLYDYNILSVLRSHI